MINFETYLTQFFGEDPERLLEVKNQCKTGDEFLTALDEYIIKFLSVTPMNIKIINPYGMTREQRMKYIEKMVDDLDVTLRMLNEYVR
jgi:hypothetical protein